MNLKQTQEDIAQGEGLHHEFKEAGSQLPRNLFETVCSFLNTDGGTILLGVADDGSVTGVNPDAVERMKSDLANLSNNPQKVDPPYLLFPYEFQIEDKTIIAVQVPLSSQLHKTGGEIFLRSEDGDYRVQGTHQLAGLINRKLSLFTEQRTLPFATIEQLRPELFDRARRLMRSYNSKHPWADLSNEELLKIGGFYAQDHQTGKPCLTLAAVLMFGTDLAIQQAVPAYKFDCLLRRDNVDRYDDRVMIYTNLIDAYDRMMEFVEKHLNDPFYQDEKANRVSLRDKIFREAISNIISHREYTGGAPARLMIYRDKVILDNPCTLHHFGEITPQNLRPFSKNPTLCKFMIQLGRFDQLGSGVTNINKYLPLYANGAKPIFNETRHGFELTIPLAEEMAVKTDLGPTQAQVGAQEAQVGAQVKFTATEKRLLQTCSENPQDSRTLAEAVGYTSRTGNFKRALEKLVKRKLLEMTIPDKPRSSKQKYRLTAKGKQLLEKTR
jgi:ATP-dependent DNA helicase RecG